MRIPGVLKPALVLHLNLSLYAFGAELGADKWRDSQLFLQRAEVGREWAELQITSRICTFESHIARAFPTKSDAENSSLHSYLKAGEFFPLCFCCLKYI